MRKMNFFKFYTFIGKLTLTNFLRIMFMFLLLLCIIGAIVNFTHKVDISLCFMDSLALLDKMGTENSTVLKLDDVLMTRFQPEPGKSIFFHETSCPHLSALTSADLMKTPESIHLNLVKLNARQACAIESAALNNPSLKVFVLFASPRYMNTNITDPIIEAILSYDNVFLRNVNLWSYAAGTPVYELLKDGGLFKSTYVVSHMSDILRYLTLWRWGGTYLDMDIVMLRSIEDVPPNYTGAESKSDLAAGVMNFAHNGFGHDVAEQCLLDLARNFDGRDWGNNGPGVVTRVLRRVCHTKNVEIMIASGKRCKGFKIYPTEAFYAIPWREWTQFFEPNYLEQTIERTKNSLVAHVWNKHSVHRKIKAGTKCAYSAMAAEHCPRVYKASGEYF